MTLAEPDHSGSGAAPAALSLDLERLRAGLRIMALRALGSADLADEAVQETLARAIDALRDARLSDPDKLGAYVAGIARHVFSHMRRDARKVVPLDGLPDTHRATGAADPLEMAVQASERERLRAAFATLTPADQQLLRSCYYEERSVVELAATQGEPAERLRKRKSRALARLREALLGGPGHASTRGATPLEDSYQRPDAREVT